MLQSSHNFFFHITRLGILAAHDARARVVWSCTPAPVPLLRLALRFGDSGGSDQGEIGRLAGPSIHGRRATNIKGPAGPTSRQSSASYDAIYDGQLELTEYLMLCMQLRCRLRA